MQVLSNEQLQRLSPSVFALEPWQAQSKNYRFIPTINVIDALRDAGFHPVRAQQSRSRIEGKANFTKHMLRFRQLNPVAYQVNDIIPEIVLINSHDGTSSYQMSLGLFRLVCSNGMVVQDANLDNIRVTHRGDRDLCQNVIDVSAQIIGEAPKALELVNRWQSLTLQAPERLALAEGAKALNDTTIDFSPERLLNYRRYADAPKPDGSSDLWKTFNVIQENLIRGGVRGRTTNNRIMRTRAVTSVDRDVKLNKALWTLAAKMAEIKTSAVLN